MPNLARMIYGLFWMLVILATGGAIVVAELTPYKHSVITLVWALALVVIVILFRNPLRLSGEEVNRRACRSLLANRDEFRVGLRIFMFAATLSSLVVFMNAWRLLGVRASDLWVVPMVYVIMILLAVLTGRMHFKLCLRVLRHSS